MLVPFNEVSIPSELILNLYPLGGGGVGGFQLRINSISEVWLELTLLTAPPPNIEDSKSGDLQCNHLLENIGGHSTTPRNRVIPSAHPPHQTKNYV